MLDPSFTDLFKHRYKCTIVCGGCRSVFRIIPDEAINIDLVHFDTGGPAPSTKKQFSEAIRRYVNPLDDYWCETCKKKCQAFKLYELVMVPEIIVCMFNLYTRRGIARWFPDSLEFPAIGDGVHSYRLVGQVEHSGSLSGGHYWARGKRADGVYMLNDMSVSPSEFKPTPETYILVYHVV